LNASSAVRVCALIVVLLPLLLLLTITILLLRCRLVGAGFLRLTLADLLIDLIDLLAEILGAVPATCGFATASTEAE